MWALICRMHVNTVCGPPFSSVADAITYEISGCVAVQGPPLLLLQMTGSA